MELIFDFGMYDASDTEYYLASGHKVIAVEANPALCAMATQRFRAEITSGRLVVENVAVSNQPGTIDLHVCGQDLGSSSTVPERLKERFPLGMYRVPTVTYQDLVAKYGKPALLKIDIEGADKEAVLSLTHETAPPYLSFEAHEDQGLESMIQHCHDCGYRDFKIIQQTSFRCIQNQDAFGDRVRLKLMRLAGFDKPLVKRIDDRYHVLGHSAGPAPWHSDGPWYRQAEILKAWKSTPHRGWYDVHAKRLGAQAVPRASAEKAGLWWWATAD